MAKTITTVVITALMVLFGMQNFDHVPVYFLVGKAVSIRLIFVILIAGTIGYLIRHFSGIHREEALKKRIFSMRRRGNAAGNNREATDSSGDDF